MSCDGKFWGREFKAKFSSQIVAKPLRSPEDLAYACQRRSADYEPTRSVDLVSQVHSDEN